MHIGILGTGFGKYHGELYKKIDPSIHLTFWGRNDSKLKKIQAELNCDYTTHLDELLDNKTLDFIDICLPSQVHTEYALKALRSNHSIFIETPAVTSIKDGIEIMDVARKVGQKVFVNMFLRYNPYYRMIHDFILSKKYGCLKHITIYRRTPPIWGSLGDDTISTALMIHDLDFATWLANPLKIVTYDVATNSNNTGAVIDCLLSSPSLKVHIQGNSMLSMGAPFSIGYEATFEDAFISYQEDSLTDTFKSTCHIYSGGKKEEIFFEPEEHCMSLLKGVIQDFKHEKESDLIIESALPGLSIAFALGKSTIKK